MPEIKSHAILYFSSLFLAVSSFSLKSRGYISRVLSLSSNLVNSQNSVLTTKAAFRCRVATCLSFIINSQASDFRVLQSFSCFLSLSKVYSYLDGYGPPDLFLAFVEMINLLIRLAIRSRRLPFCS